MFSFGWARLVTGQLLCALMVAPAVLADTRYELDSTLSESVPNAPPPWTTILFETLFPGTVRLTIEAGLESSSEFISDVAFNLNPVLLSSSISLQQVSGPLFSSALFATDSVRLPGGGSAGRGFDVLLSWPTASGADRFNVTDVAVFTLTGATNLTAEDFNFANSSGIAVGAHVQGIALPDGGTTSSAIYDTPVVPEPSPFALGLAALFWAGWRECRHRHKANDARHSA